MGDLIATKDHEKTQKKQVAPPRDQPAKLTVRNITACVSPKVGEGQRTPYPA
jgi:hypothetical protein